MPPGREESDAEYSENEQAQRRDEALRRALKMPPKHHVRASDARSELEEIARRFNAAREEAGALGQQLSSLANRTVRS
jgi:hypothetical protein